MTWTETITLAVLCVGVPACDPEGAVVDGEMDPQMGPQMEPQMEPRMDVGTGEPDAAVGDVFLRNRVALDMAILIQPLDADTAPPCDEVDADPAAVLRPEHFASGRTDTLGPHEVTVVWPHAPGERECYAARIESDGLGARILFWWDGDPPPRVAPDDCCSDGPGIVQLIPTDDGWSLHLIGDTRLVHTPAE